MRSSNTAAVKIVITFTFALLLVAAGVFVYQPQQAGVTTFVQAMDVPSDSCIDCHTNPAAIEALASEPELAAGGG